MLCSKIYLILTNILVIPEIFIECLENLKAGECSVGLLIECKLN